MANDPFKVVVIGGGPSGLIAAYALYHAGIEFVVLERRNEVAEDLGASLVLSPGSLRVLHQFGILRQVLDIGETVKWTKGFTMGGECFMHGDVLNILREHLGVGPQAFHRAELIQTLYDNLPEPAKACYFTGKKLASITTTETGVVVNCEDGSSYSGNIVIGADGVHSKTRQEMRRLAIESDPSLEGSWDPVSPYKTEYQCLWASFPRPTESGESTETQHKDKSIMYLTGKDRGWIFLYEKLPKATTERITFSNDDLNAYAGRFMDWPLNDTLTVKDVWNERYTAGAAGLEEGMCKHWSWNGKIALVGDAAHKFTPNAGLGFNNGIQDVVSLCNKLHKFVDESKGRPLDFVALESLLQISRQERQELVSGDLQQSAFVTRTHAWSSIWTWIFARYIMPQRFVQWMMATFLMTPKIRKAGVLDFLSVSEPFAGTYAWLNPLTSGSKS